MDPKEKIEELVTRAKDDKGLLAKLKDNPLDTLKEMLGDLPTDKIKEIWESIKDKFDFSPLDADGDGKKDEGGFFRKITTALDSDGDGKMDLKGLKNIGDVFKKKDEE